MTQNVSPSGWYVNPENKEEYRYWDAATGWSKEIMPIQAPAPAYAASHSTVHRYDNERGSNDEGKRRRTGFYPDPKNYSNARFYYGMGLWAPATDPNKVTPLADYPAALKTQRTLRITAFLLPLIGCLPLGIELLVYVQGKLQGSLLEGILMAVVFSSIIFVSFYSFYRSYRNLVTTYHENPAACIEHSQSLRDGEESNMTRSLIIMGIIIPVLAFFAIMLRVIIR